MELTVKKFGRPAALGALAVCVGILGVYLVIVFGSRPTATGGIDDTQAVLTWISVAVPVALIIVAHVVAARVLLRYANEPDDT